MAKKESDREKKNLGGEEPSSGLLSRIGAVLKGDGAEEDRPKSATKLLKEDHDKVRELFKRWEKAEGQRVARGEIVREACFELTVHSEIEEKIFYPAVRDAGRREPEQLVRESYEEHKLAKTLIGELNGMSPTDAQFEAKFIVLKELVEHHADEEENELFPEVEDLFSSEKLESLGAEMQDLKEELKDSLEGEPEAGRRAAVRPKAPTGSKSAARGRGKSAPGRANRPRA
jgi:hemerythrin-like domain-containing protein